MLGVGLDSIQEALVRSVGILFDDECHDAGLTGGSR